MECRAGALPVPQANKKDLYGGRRSTRSSRLECAIFFVTHGLYPEKTEGFLRGVPCRADFF